MRENLLVSDPAELGPQPVRPHVVSPICFLDARSAGNSPRKREGGTFSAPAQEKIKSNSEITLIIATMQENIGTRIQKVRQAA
jgi:hypothetical protein